MKLLIIEDDVLIAEWIENETIEYVDDVRVAYSSKEAERLLKSYTPDVIFSDFDLSENQNGSQICNNLLSDIPNTRYVIISGADKEELGDIFDNPKLLAVIKKPVSGAELRKILELARA